MDGVKNPSLSERRRQRYHSDPAYRRVVLDRNAAYRRKNPRPRVHTVRDYLRAREVARAVPITYKTLCRWHSVGYLPDAYGGRRRRRYTPRQAELVKEFAQWFLPRRCNLRSKRHDRKEWRELVLLVTSIRERWNG
jgi:hypothetical protein